MNQIKKTSSTLNLKNSPLAKLLIGASKGGITGYIKITQEDLNKPLRIWWLSGNIVGVTGIVSLISKLEVYQLVSPRIIPNIKAEKLVAPIGKKLTKVYELKPEAIERLFQEQIQEIINRIGAKEGEVKIVRLKDTKGFPFQELTGLNISGYELVKRALEENFTQRYLDKVPERERTIEAGITQLDRVKLEREYLEIIRFCNTNATLIQIAKKLEIPLQKLQKKVLILNTLELVKVGITKDAALELWQKFNPDSSSIKGRNISFNQKNSWQAPVATISLINLVIIALTWLGSFQSIELGLRDRWVRLRGTKQNQDITIVAMNDQDIAKFPSYPVADRYLAQVLNNIAKYQPSAIGLDIYRDLPQEPGHKKLLQAYQDIGQLVGVEKIDEGDRVNPPPILGMEDRVGFSDLILDSDKIIRRGTWMVEDNGKLKFNLGALTALYSLDRQGVPIEQDSQDPYKYTIAESTFSNLTNNSGGYWQGEIDGLQTIIGFNYNTNDFKTISFINAYRGTFDPNDIKNKIVLIGVTADSKKDFVYSPLSKVNSRSRPMPGVIAHANIAADFIDAARGKKPIQVNSKLWEIGWIVAWSILGIGVGIIALELNLKRNQKRYQVISLQGLVITLASIGSGAMAFLVGSLWVPVVPSLLSALGSSTIVNFQYQKELEALIYSDKASKVANRRYFDSVFENYLLQVNSREGNLGLILCQIIDWDKIESNLEQKAANNYLREVAKEITRKIKQDNADNIIGRFTDNTFAVLILDTNEVKLNELTEAINSSIKVNKTLVKTGVPYLEFGSAISDRKINNTFALIAEADEKLNSS